MRQGRYRYAAWTLQERHTDTAKTAQGRRNGTLRERHVDTAGELQKRSWDAAPAAGPPQGCYQDAAKTSQGRYRDATEKLEGCDRDAAGTPQGRCGDNAGTQGGRNRELPFKRPRLASADTAQR